LQREADHQLEILNSNVTDEKLLSDPAKEGYCLTKIRQNLKKDGLKVDTYALWHSLQKELVFSA